MLVRDHIQLVRARKMFAECVNIGAGLMLHCLWVGGKLSTSERAASAACRRHLLPSAASPGPRIAAVACAKHGRRHCHPL